MKENEFAVRSYLPGDDPSVVLAELAQETPFFFQQRADLLRELLKQNQLAHGLAGAARRKSKYSNIRPKWRIASCGTRQFATC